MFTNGPVANETAKSQANSTDLVNGLVIETGGAVDRVTDCRNL